MKKKDIKNILIVHSDNDFIRVWDWIGKITLMTITNTNICGCEVLEDTEDIEKFIHSLLPTAIEFIQYKENKYTKPNRYQNIDRNEVDRLTEYFDKIKFVYNFNETNEYYLSGGSETLIIDLQKKEISLLVIYAW